MELFWPACGLQYPCASAIGAPAYDYVHPVENSPEEPRRCSPQPRGSQRPGDPHRHLRLHGVERRHEHLPGRHPVDRRQLRLRRPEHGRRLRADLRRPAEHTGFQPAVSRLQRLRRGERRSAQPRRGNRDDHGLDALLLRSDRSVGIRSGIGHQRRLRCRRRHGLRHRRLHDHGCRPEQLDAVHALLEEPVILRSQRRQQRLGQLE